MDRRIHQSLSGGGAFPVAGGGDETGVKWWMTSNKNLKTGSSNESTFL